MSHSFSTIFLVGTRIRVVLMFLRDDSKRRRFLLSGCTIQNQHRWQEAQPPVNYLSATGFYYYHGALNYLLDIVINANFSTQCGIYGGTICTCLGLPVAPTIK